MRFKGIPDGGPNFSLERPEIFGREEQAGAGIVSLPIKKSKIVWQGHKGRVPDIVDFGIAKDTKNV